MNTPTDSLPSITISPPSAPEQETDNVNQKIFTAPKVDQMPNYDSSDDGLDGPLPSARPVPTFRPAQPKTNPSINLYQSNSNGQLEIQYPLDRDKIHKLHLDMHLRRHHRPQQPEHDEEPLGFNYNRERERMHKLHLKLHLPRHSSPSRIDAPIVFMTTLPALKYHEHLECITYPRLTQKEYEQRIMTRE